MSATSVRPGPTSSFETRAHARAPQDEVGLKGSALLHTTLAPLPLEPRGLDDRKPLLDLGFVQVAQRLRRLLREWRHFLSQIEVTLADGCIRERRDDRGVEFCDDVLRRAGGRPQPGPV